MRRRSGGAARRTRRALALTVLGALVLTGGCGGDGDGAADDGSTTTEAPPPPSLAPPGAPIGESGLVVPDGAHLAGPAFGGPDLALGGGWGALLTVEDDPFAVLDGVAAQVRASGATMPGSGSACMWGVDTTGEGRADEGVPVVDGEPAGTVVELRCEASGRGPSTGAEDDISEATASLEWGRGTTGAIWLTWSTRQTDQGAGGFGAASGPGPVQPTPGFDEPEPAPFGPDPVPTSARRLLPDRAGPTSPDVGERFGAASSCHSGYDRFRLPVGARLVAAQGGVDGPSVLEVDRVEPVLDALAGQADTTDAFAADDVVEVTTPAGTQVPRRTWVITGGGGGCTLLGSPDGHHVLVTSQSD
ncbi:hypothetical protein PO878_16430 [Iamia majanohamensis]|uniref:Uncharacterized protein n=1 Tax=Iamia majanohamensis TaxID=467976 RepID=A0AAE9Y7X2_9ACTN|nr:hypothetical protein [Iamia majanohamensis]WCO66088.1 hypothetical protein PO878_16430 [Iamia majanohamensis]